MNQCILTGNLGNDPEIHFAQDGTQIAVFSMAFRSFGDKTNWIKVSCNNKLAQVVETYLHKGAKVAVSGLIDQTKWETDGTTRTSFRVLANQIEFLKTDGRGMENEGGNETKHAAQGAGDTESGNEVAF